MSKMSEILQVLADKNKQLLELEHHINDTNSAHISEDGSMFLVGSLEPYSSYTPRIYLNKEESRNLYLWLHGAYSESV